ncbi:hypothetical protein CMUS01_09697 [Colletotrichum musicola]|uniref:Uncharacterized protein n=1 Tax=Colletotrichum musicola TaxID=2175873 RepID=A0A8H6N9W4_9PEZI|nr:hypothetical protein CMUS01_09697 [Colletotrichum musicola]
MTWLRSSLRDFVRHDPTYPPAHAPDWAPRNHAPEVLRHDSWTYLGSKPKETTPVDRRSRWCSRDSLDDPLNDDPHREPVKHTHSPKNRGVPRRPLGRLDHGRGFVIRWQSHAGSRREGGGRIRAHNTDGKLHREKRGPRDTPTPAGGIPYPWRRGPARRSQPPPRLPGKRSGTGSGGRHSGPAADGSGVGGAAKQNPKALELSADEASLQSAEPQGTPKLAPGTPCAWNRASCPVPHEGSPRVATATHTATTIGQFIEGLAG